MCLLIFGGHLAVSGQLAEGKRIEDPDTSTTPIANQTDNTTVGITSPQEDTVFLPPRDLELSVQVEGGFGDVVRIDYFQGAEFLASATEAPFSHTWRNVPEGIHAITANVISNDGSEMFSDPVSIAVLRETPSDPPQIRISPRLPNDAVAFHLLSAPGNQVTFEQSEDLSAWSSLASGRQTSGLLSVHLTIGGTSRKFVRAVTTEPTELGLLELEVTSARPGAIISVQATGLNPDNQIFAHFFNDSGFDAEVPIVRASPTEARVSVPPYFNLVSEDFSEGMVNLRLIQRTEFTETVSNTQPGFRIENLPETSLPPGTLTRALLLGSYRQSQYALSGINLIEVASEGTPLGVDLADALLEMQELTLGAIGDVEQIISHPESSINYGSIDGEELFLTSADLAISDRIILSWLLEVQSKVPREEAAPLDLAFHPVPRQSLELQENDDPCSYSAPPPPISAATPDALAQRIYQLREYADLTREWTEYGVGYIQSIRTGLGWLPPDVSPVKIRAVAHALAILAGTATSYALDAAASSLESGSLEYEDFNRATEFARKNRLYEVSEEALLEFLKGSFKTAAGPYAPVVDWGLYLSGISEKTETLRQGLQPDDLWADDSPLVLQAGPLPVITANGCLSQISGEVAASEGSVSLVVSGGFKPLTAPVDESGRYELKIPQSKIGSIVPETATIKAMIRENEVISQTIDLTSGSQTVDFIFGRDVDPMPSGTTYNLLDLGASSENTLVVDLNNNGQVLVVRYKDEYWEEGDYELLNISNLTIERVPLEPSPPYWPKAINDSGVIVGSKDRVLGEDAVDAIGALSDVAYIRQPNGTINFLPSLTTVEEGEITMDYSVREQLRDDDGNLVDRYKFVTRSRTEKIWHDTQALGINNAGIVVGNSDHFRLKNEFYDIDSLSRATLWRSGVPEDLGTLHSRELVWIDTREQIVDSEVLGPKDYSHWELGSPSTTLGHGISGALGINDHNSVIGWSREGGRIYGKFEATLWPNGSNRPVSLGDLPLSPISTIIINNNDWIIVVDSTLLWINNRLTQLPSPHEFVFLQDLNNLNQIVGISFSLDLDFSPLLWMRDESSSQFQVFDLNESLAAPLQTQWTIGSVDKINDSGQIAGTAIFDEDGDGFDSDDPSRLVLLIPQNN